MLAGRDASTAMPCVHAMGWQACSCCCAEAGAVVPAPVGCWNTSGQLVLASSRHASPWFVSCSVMVLLHGSICTVIGAASHTADSVGLA